MKTDDIRGSAALLRHCRGKYLSYGTLVTLIMAQKPVET